MKSAVLAAQTEIPFNKQVDIGMSSKMVDT